MVEADKSKIFEVLSNLIRNAIRFVGNDGRIIISAEKSDDGRDVVVAVKDNGRGIDPEVLTRLFQKFAASSDLGGTGLGLYISKSIVEAHRGRIWAENNRGGQVGAMVTFTLPLLKAISS
jgi:signal transduction histidine kinase